jgi:hypothetical protein
MKSVFGVCGGSDGCSSSMAPWFSRYSGLYVTASLHPLPITDILHAVVW